MNEAELIDFVRARIGSVYTLELLLLMKRDPARAWQANDLVRELRSSRTAVAEALGRLSEAGLISGKPDGHYVYAPANAERQQMADAIEKSYASTPFAVMKAIIGAPEQKLRAFSDAFKLKE